MSALPPIVSIATGGDHDSATALWMATEDGSIWRLILGINEPTPPFSRDPADQWQWEKIPIIQWPAKAEISSITTGGPNDSNSALWAAFDDGSVWRLTLTTNNPFNPNISRDPADQWNWEKIPQIQMPAGYIPPIPPPPATDGGTTIWGETPIGVIDGVNKNYTSAYPYRPNLLGVFLNGLRQQRNNDYTETGSQSFSFINAPLPGDSLSIDYVQP